MAKAVLSRQAFVDVALTLINEQGVAQLSMRKVAAKLNVSAMAMYKHFPNKDALLAAALEEVIARADVYPPNELPWQDWIEHVARGMYQALCDEASWVPLLGALRLGNQAGTVTVSFVEKMVVSGFTPEQALRAYFSVIQVVIGAVCLRSSLKLEQFQKAPETPGKEDTEKSTDLLEQLLSEDLLAVLNSDQLDISLPILLNALETQLL